MEVCPNIAFPPRAPVTDAPSQDRAAARAIGATFYPQSGTILLSPRSDLNGIPGMAQLIHELVHAYQYATGRDAEVACKQELEPQAFAIQIAFLQDNGYDDEARRLAVKASLSGLCPLRRTPTD